LLVGVTEKDWRELRLVILAVTPELMLSIAFPPESVVEIVKELVVAWERGFTSPPRSM